MPKELKFLGIDSGYSGVDIRKFGEDLNKIVHMRLFLLKIS